MLFIVGGMRNASADAGSSLEALSLSETKHWVMTNPHLAISSIERRLSEGVDSQDFWLAMRGEALINLDRLYEATQSFEAALSLVSEASQSEEAIHIRSRIGYIYFLTGDLEMAKAVLLGEFLEARKSGWSSLAAQISFDLGTVYLELGEINKARQLLDEASGFIIGYADYFYYKSQLLLALTEFNSGASESSFVLLEDAINGFQKSGNFQDLANAYLVAGDFNVQTGNFDEAIESVRVATELADTYSMSTISRKAFRLLAKAYAGNGTYRDAYQYLIAANAAETEFLESVKEENFLALRSDLFMQLSGNAIVNTQPEPLPIPEKSVGFSLLLILLLFVLIVLLLSVLVWYLVQFNPLKAIRKPRNEQLNDSEGSAQKKEIGPAGMSPPALKSISIGKVLICDRSSLSRSVYRLHAEEIGLQVHEVDSPDEVLKLLKNGYRATGYLVGYYQDQDTLIHCIEKIIQYSNINTTVAVVGDNMTASRVGREIQSSSLINFLERPVEKTELHRIYAMIQKQLEVGSDTLSEWSTGSADMEKSS